MTLAGALAERPDLVLRAQAYTACTDRNKAGRPPPATKLGRDHPGIPVPAHPAVRQPGVLMAETAPIPSLLTTSGIDKVEAITGRTPKGGAGSAELPAPPRSQADGICRLTRPGR
jgi:hypothetical protein